MAWLPDEDAIAGESERLVLRYHPSWSGAGERRRLIGTPQEAKGLFETQEAFLFDLDVPFTRESWNGRMLVCRGIGASLSPERARAFAAEHMRLPQRIAPEQFTVRHYAAMTILRVIK